MKKKITCLFLIFIFALAQLTGGLVRKTAAAENSFGVQVVVQSFDKVLTSGTSIKSNALEAVDEVLKKANIAYTALNSSWGGKYISEIGGIKAAAFGGYDGWLYAVNRGGKYPDIFTSIDGFTLQNGDRLIIFYGDFNTLTANKINFSSKKSGESLEITLNNTYIDYQTGMPVVQPIKGIQKAILDSKEYTVTQGRLVVPEGLNWGRHTLALSDFAADKCPAVVADSIEFEFSPEAYIRVEGLSGTITEGRQQGQNLYEMVERLLKEKGVNYNVVTGQGWKYISSIEGLEAGRFKGWDGWLAYYKRGSVIDAPAVAWDSFIPEENDYYVVYFGDPRYTPYVNTIQFSPRIVKENENFKIKFSYREYDSSGTVTKEMLIGKAIVTIDGVNYITDDKGEIDVSGLAKGEHSYTISGYNIDKLPAVVMDKGIFVIDNVNSPSLIYDAEKFAARDNTGIKKDIPGEINSIKGYLSSKGDDPWASLILQKLGIKGGESYIKEMANTLLKYGILDPLTTDLEKLILNLTALGYNPYNFAGMDLMKELFSRSTEDLLINDAIFALLVYNYANVSEEYSLSREKLVEYILKNKLSYEDKGSKMEGWALAGDKINPDITGAVLSALAPFNDDKHPEVQASIQSAVNSLSLLQNEDGNLPDSFGRFSESLSFAIIGLAAVGENPEGVKFTKSKGDLVSALISFKGTDGQYKHSLDTGNNYMATEQALRAFYTLEQYKSSGKYDFYKSTINARELPVYNFVPVISEPAVEGHIFDFIRGTDKTLEYKLTKAGKDILTWTFNGMDINSEVKDIDLTLNDVPEHGTKILSMINNYDAQILSFKNNGVLPGKAKLKVKLEEQWLQSKDRNNIYLYYYNDKEEQIEKIAGPLQADENNYVEFELTHCSDYFLTDKVLVLPATGSSIDTKVLVGLGLLILSAGLVLIFGKKFIKKKSV